jgi:hypothetical protein
MLRRWLTGLRRLPGRVLQNKMNISHASDVRIAAATAIADAINSRPGPLILNLYDGTQPSAGGTPNGNLIVAPQLADPPCSVGGVGGYQVIFYFENTTTQVSYTSTPTWGRIIDNNGDWVMDADAGTGDQFFKVDVAPIYQNGFIVMGNVVLTIE